VIIAAAGGAAHLPGMVAAHTTLPVFGVPIESHTLRGVDSLLSIVQMPAACRWGRSRSAEAGAANAALLAIAVLANHDANLRDASAPSAQDQERQVRESSLVTGPILPGATIGVLGSGQLGRMFAMAARRMGYRVHTLSPDDDTPTGQVADLEIAAPYEDLDAVRAFARQVDVVTFEFENVPAETADEAALHAAGATRGAHPPHHPAAGAREDVSSRTTASR
jgi:hypothetical protein